jgi:hypothetical protein
MKKQELIHLHGLMGELRKQYEAWGENPDLEGYEDLGVKPASIHRSKTDHKAAVFELAEGLTGEETESELNPYDEDELYHILEENAEQSQVPTPNGITSRPTVELTVDVMTAIYQVIGNWNLQDELTRLEQREKIESDDDNYRIGADLYLKV